VYKKAVKETACIQGSTDGNAFIQYYEKLLNTTNTGELKLEQNSADHSDVSITFYELEKALKVTKHDKIQGHDNINSDLNT
jgi:hypothetical protein